MRQTPSENLTVLDEALLEGLLNVVRGEHAR